MKNEIFIRFKYNSLLKVKDFESELENFYLVQKKPIYIPSATDGDEMWFQIFLNINYKDFLLGASAAGLTWDLIKYGTKKYFLKPLFSAIDKLVENNKDNSYVDFKKFEFEFNDLTIKIQGIKSLQISKLSAIFSTLFKVIPKLEQKELGELSEIIIPLKMQEDKLVLIDEYEELPLPEDYLKYWLIKYNYGMDIFSYDIGNDKIIG